MAGPGDDNVTGNNYTLNLGVEPDLGGVLQNLTVANELLDQAQDKFKTIADIVGTTTQKMHQLTRATQLFVSETNNAKTSYQQLANAAGAGPPTAAPRVTPQTVGSAMAQTSLINQWGGMGALTYGYSGAGPPGGPPGGGGGPPGGPPWPPGPGGGPGGGMNIPFYLRAAQIAQIPGAGRFLSGGGMYRAPGAGFGNLQDLTRGGNIGWKLQLGEGLTENEAKYMANYFKMASSTAGGMYATQGDRLMGALGGNIINTGSGLQAVGGGTAAQKLIAGASSDADARLLAKFGSAAYRGGSFADLDLDEQQRLIQIAGAGGALKELGVTNFLPGTALGRFGGEAMALAGRASPYVIGATAAGYAASWLGNTITQPARTAQAYSGLTGGTSVIGAGPGSFGESAEGYNTLIRNISGEYGFGPFSTDFIHPLVNKQQAQEIVQTTLAAGYGTGGGLTEGSVSGKGGQMIQFLTETTRMGLQDVTQMAQLFQQTIDSAGGSTQGLVSTLNDFAAIARTSDVGMQPLIASFTQMNQQWQQFGASTALTSAVQTRYAQQMQGAATYEVRTSAPVMTDFQNAEIGAAFGLDPFQFQAAMTNPANAGQIADVQAGYAKQFLTSIGLRPGMTISYLNSDPQGLVLGGQLIQMYKSGLLTQVAGAKEGMTPAAVLDWAITTINGGTYNPETGQVEQATGATAAGGTTTSAANTAASVGVGVQTTGTYVPEATRATQGAGQAPGRERGARAPQEDGGDKSRQKEMENGVYNALVRYNRHHGKKRNWAGE